MQSDDLGLVARLRTDAAYLRRRRAGSAPVIADDCDEAAAAIERLVAERDEAREQALDQFAREYSEAYGCDPVAMANGRSNWRKSAEAAEAQRDKLKEALTEISCPTQTDKLLWWQTRARQALKDAP